MAKKDITLSMQDWALILQTFAGAPAPQDQGTWGKHFRLWDLLDRRITEAEGEELTIKLTRAQREPLIRVMVQPSVPWRMNAKPRIWSILQTLGWVPPEIEEDDPDEDEEGDE